MQSTIVVQNIDILRIVDTFQKKFFFLIICLQFKIINVENVFWVTDASMFSFNIVKLNSRII